MAEGMSLGAGKLYPHLLSTGMMEMDELCELAAEETTFGKAEIKGALGTLLRKVALMLGQGYTVRLDGLGTFRPALRLRKDAEREEADSQTHRNAASFRIAKLNFRADDELLYQVNRLADLERVMPRKAAQKPPMAEDERRQCLRDYLEHNPLIRVADYSWLTGLNSTAAQRELRRISREEGTFLSRKGRGAHLVYVLCRDVQETEA